MKSTLRNRWQVTSVRTASLLLAAVTGLLHAQSQPPLDPPALPAAATAGTFGPALPLPPGAGNTTITTFSSNPSAWTSTGPGPLTESGGAASGRIAGVAVDQTNGNIYVAAAGGGVWKSTDGGATYTPLTDTQSSLAMGAIAIAPSNHLRIYAGTGEGNNALDSNFGRGILVSSDGGATWNLSTGPSGIFDRLGFTKISVHPANELIAYASVTNTSENGNGGSGTTGIYGTTDGGVTWTNLTSAAGLDSGNSWSDVVVDPVTPTTIYAAHGDIFGHSANGVYQSTNSGQTWTLLANAPSGAGTGRIALAVGSLAPGGAGTHTLYAAFTVPLSLAGGGTLYEMLVSQNADSPTPTFTLLNNTPNFGGSGAQGWYDWIVSVDPSNNSIVYCAGALNYNNNTDHVIQTTNGGASWTDLTSLHGVQPHTDSHAMAFDSSGNMFLGNDGGLWRYNKSAGAWTNLNGNMNTIQFTGIGLHPTNSLAIVGGSQDNGTEVYAGNVNWPSTDGGDGGYSQYSQTAPSTVYSNHPIGSFGITSFFRVSTNGGSSWTSRTPTISNQNNFDFYSPIFVDPSNGARVFLGGDALYESTSSGSSWVKHTSPATVAIDSIAVQPGGNIVYVSTGGTYSSSSHVWISTNDGGAWSAIDLPGGLRVQELDVDPNDSTGETVIAVSNRFNGAGGQVFRSTNGGAAWTNISGNLPAVPTWSAKIDTDFNKTIYVSNETGVWFSPSPYGAWTAMGTGLPNAQGVSLQLNTSTHQLGVGTHGRGVWTISTSIVNYQAPTISKAFSPSSITSGGNSTVTVTLTNPNTSLSLTGAAFSDTLTNMTVASTTVGGTCAPTPSALIVGAASVSFSGISIAANSNCTVTFVVTSTSLGSNPNTTSGVTTTQTPAAGSPSATVNLTVYAAPTISKTFLPTSITSGGNSTVTLTLSNSNATALTGGAFTDTLANMSLVAGSLGGACAGTSLSGTSTSLSFSAITIPANGNCTVTFNVTSATLGSNPNTTSGVTTSQTTLGPPSNSANLTVTSASSAPTVVSYNVICGTNCIYNVIGAGRVHLPWQITGIQVVFSQPIASATISSLTGVAATGLSGLGTNTLTWTFAAVTNSHGSLSTALATTGANAIQSAGSTNLTGGNTSASLKILEGDFNDDGVVNASDSVLVNNARAGAYNILADLNGDGALNALDVAVVRTQLGQTNP